MIINTPRFGLPHRGIVDVLKSFCFEYHSDFNTTSPFLSDLGARDIHRRLNLFAFL